MEKRLKEACEEIDSAVFSGDALFFPETKAALKEYVRRWANAILEHESTEGDGVKTLRGEGEPEDTGAFVVDVCTDPENCRRCSSHPLVKHQYQHAGIPL